MNKEPMINEMYKDAIMDICKAKRLPEKFEKLLNAKFNKLFINNTYTATISNESDCSVLKFNVEKTENFPGDALISQKLLIREWNKENNWKENFIYGTIILTYHDDLGQWLGYLHLLDEEKEINRLEQIANVEFFLDTHCVKSKK